MSAVCSSRAQLAVWGISAHGGAAGSGGLEVGSPGRAVAEALGREISAMGGANVWVSGNGISLRFCENSGREAAPTAGESTSSNGIFIRCGCNYGGQAVSMAVKSVPDNGNFSRCG